MPTNESGMGWIFILFIIVVLFLFFCRGGDGLFGGGCGNNFACNRVSTCEVEKQEIIDSARNQFLIGQEGSATRAAIRDSQDVITAQANRIYEQSLQERIFDLKLENQSLRGNIFTKDQTDAIAKTLSDCCCGFNRRLDAIECQMLKTPPFFPTGNTFQGYGNCGQCGNGSY